MNRWILVFVAACLGVSGCRRDPPPEETVKEFEEDVGHGKAGQARALLTAQQAQDADTLFMGVRAEEHNRLAEGIVSEHRSTETTGVSARVKAVYVMKDNVRRIYTWELLRDQGRWRISSWEAEVSGIVRPGRLTPTR